MVNVIFSGITSLFLSKITVLLIDAIAVYLAIVVYRDNKKGELNKIYILMTFLMMCWVNFAYIPRFLITPIVYPLSLILLKIAWIATPLFFYLLYYITIVLIKKKEKHALLSKAVLFISILSAVVTGFTNYIITGLEVIDGIVTINYGPWMYPFLCTIIFIIFATIYPVFKKDILKDSKVRHFLVGIFIFYFANAIFNIALPIFFGVSRFYFIGDYSTLILLAYTAYSILRHELFEIKVVAAEVLTFSIWIALTSDIFTSENIKDKFFEIIILLLTIIFGILLLKSVKNEIKQREKLEKLTNQLKIINTKLKKLDAIKSEFISIASHQLRTPLTVIKGYLSMIRDGDFGALGQKLVDPLEKIYDSSERMISLVANLLNVSRIESGKIQFNFTEMQLEDLVKSVYEELQSKAKLKNLRFEYIAPDALLPKVKIDEEKIRQVIMNLTENSIKYTNEGSVTMKLKLENKDIRFCVYDTGAGIKKSDMGKLFQKFSRGTGSTQAIEGTGLGLFVAKQMIEAHRGTIWAESKGEGKGSKFCFLLPAGK